ncbi:hypothetical protein [Pseudomonas sp. 2(2015)]|uniref:hypothetical protein n=1 Tax=Pseudomonas sp. 2(2015) TaxID=1619950 RepID=UPI0012E0B36D|nr:hypothetical protein [Pseudomonas sp. 2(2015)]
MNGAVTQSVPSPREREEAARQLLAGIAVLDGNHPPVLVWPEAATLRERANWLSDQAKDFLERADLFDARMAAFSSDEPQALEEQTGYVQASKESAPIPQSSVSSASAHLEVEKDSRLQSCPRIDQGSSDAC